jgi:hypothetical protein
MFHPYVIGLDNGKYTVINDNGRLTLKGTGEEWPPVQKMADSKLVLAMAQRIQELEVAMRAVVDGPLLANGTRLREETPSWLAAHGSPRAESIMIGWHNSLERVLEQKP